MEQGFADLTLAESVKARLEEYMSHRCFAVELVNESPNELPRDYDSGRTS